MSTKAEKTMPGTVKMSSWEDCGWISLVYSERMALGLVFFVLSKMTIARISGNAKMSGGDGKMREHPKRCFDCC